MDHQLKIRLMNLQDRLKSWQFSKLWHLEIYDDPSQKKVIMSQMPNYDVYLAKKAKSLADGKGAPSEFLFMYAEPILTHEQQYHLFRQYNFLKYKYKQLAQVENLKYNQIASTVRDLENYYAQMREVKQKLICSNARITMNLARKANLPNLEAGLSDGCLGLTMAIDYFDFRKGIKFITYCYVVVNDHIRKCRFGEMKAAAFTNNEESTWDIIAPNMDVEVEMEKLERAKSIENDLQRIPERERAVICYYYGLMGGKEHNLEEIGKKMRISKERVRQIKSVGLERIKRNGFSYGQSKTSQGRISLQP